MYAALLEDASVLEVAEPAVQEWRDGLLVHDDNLCSLGSADPECVCEELYNSGSRIRVAAADPWRDGYGVPDDNRCILGSAVRECVCGIDDNPGSRIRVEAADP